MSTTNTSTPILVSALVAIVASAGVAYVITQQVLSERLESLQAQEVSMDSGLIVHISSGTDDPHAQMMGLQKALKSAEAGTEAFVFMDVHATDLALEATDISFADFPSSQALIASLLEQGVGVYVCGHCLMVNGNTMEEVQPGIQELTMDAMMAFTHGRSVVALDY